MSRNTTSSTVSRSAAGFHLFRYEKFVFVSLLSLLFCLYVVFFFASIFSCFPVFPFSRFSVCLLCFHFLVFVCFCRVFSSSFFPPSRLFFFVEFSWRCAGNPLPFFRSVRRRRFVIKTAFCIPARSGIRWPKGLTFAFTTITKV